MAAVARRGVLRVAWRGCVLIPGSRINCQYATLASTFQVPCHISAPPDVTVQQRRQSSFFNKLTADELWKGVLAESGAGGRKGRGKRTKRRLKKDLNRGQVIGEGQSGFLWPGLNAPVLKQGSIQAIGQRGKEEQEKLQSERLRQQEEWDKKRKMRVKRERGWTGISLGPPDPGPNGETYDDFDSRVIEVKSVFNMTAREGRKRSVSALVAVGNGKGAAEKSYKKVWIKVQRQEDDSFLKTLCRLPAKNRAIHYLHYIERYEYHTIYHDIAAFFKKTTIRMKKQNRGLCSMGKRSR